MAWVRQSSAGEVVFKATYMSPCPNNGGSDFEVTRFMGEKADGGASHQFLLSESIMLVASRQPPACDSPMPFEQEYTVEVRSLLPADLNLGIGGTKFLACPPGSMYEMVKLGTERAAAPGPAFLNAARATPSQQAVVPPVSRPLDWDDEEDGVWQPPPGQENASEADASGAPPTVDALGGSAAAAAAAATAASS